VCVCVCVRACVCVCVCVCARARMLAWKSVNFPSRPPPGPRPGRRTQGTMLSNPGPSVLARGAVVSRFRETAAGT
jgi:hypothetical protein